jgi:hypothetical protein
MHFPPLSQRQHSSAVDRKVCNAAGKDIFSINVEGPSQDDFSRPEAGIPEEYVRVKRSDLPEDQSEEFSLWVMKARRGNAWECHCFQQGEHLGYFSEDLSVGHSSLAEGRKFVLKTESRISFRATPEILTVEGTLQNPPLWIMQKGVLAATVDPGRETRLGGYTYQATCQPDANVGLVVLALVGMDRLMCHGSTPRTSEASR